MQLVSCSFVKQFPSRVKGGMAFRCSSDIVAASVVVILLKMCFVLDGQNEWSMDVKHDCCLKHEASPEICQPFTWRRWIMQHLTHTSSHSKSFLYPMTDEGPADLHTCMEHYLNVVLKGVSYKTVRVCKKVVHFKEITEMRQLPFKRLAELQGSSDIIDEKYQERISDSYLNLLGREANTSSGNLTSACVNSILEHVTSRDDDYYAYYGGPPDEQTLDCYPSSYAFVLSLLMDVTKAPWKAIHEQVIESEARVFSSVL